MNPMRRLRYRRLREGMELELTPFINLMVVLVPYLLISAVFTQLVNFQVSPPAPTDNTQVAPQAQQMNLQLVVRNNYVSVRDAQGGLIRRIEVQPDKIDLHELGEVLYAIKQRLPNKNNITLLVDPQVNYDLLIKVMDMVRIRHQLDPQGRAVQAALFPDIAMGDAPPASSGQ